MMKKLLRKGLAAAALLFTAVPAAKAATFEGLSDNQEQVRALIDLRPHRSYMLGPDAPVRMMRNRIEQLEDAAADFYGDSTFRDSSSMVSRFATSLAARYTTHRVELAVAANNMQSITTTVVQEGPSGRRYRYFPSDAANGAFMPSTMAIAAPTATNLLTLEVVFSLDADRLSAGKPTAAMKLMGFNSNPSPTELVINTNGILEFNHRDSGGSYVFNWPSTAAVAGGNMVAGTRYGVRVTLNPDNGSGNRIINYYTSTNDGGTWTQLGTANQSSAASSIGTGASYAYWIGTYGGTPSRGIKYYQANVRIGTTQRLILPSRIDLFHHVAGATTGNSELGGSPTIYIGQMAQDAATIQTDGFFTGTGAGDLTTESYRCFVNRWPDFVVIASSHNDDSTANFADWEVRMDAAVTSVTALYPWVPPVIHMTQNPEPADYADGALAFLHNQRQKFIPLYAQKKGRGCAHIFQAFIDLNNPANALSGNVHPSPTGYETWATWWWDCFLSGSNLNN